MPRKHPPAFKCAVDRQIDAGEGSQAAGCRDSELDHSLVEGCQHRAREPGSQASPGSQPGDGAPRPPDNLTTIGAAEARIAELERLVGQLALENQFLQQALQQVSSGKRKRSP